MTVYVNLTPQEMKLIKDCAKSHNIEAADFIKMTIINKIKEESDFYCFHQLHPQNKYSSEDELLVLLDDQNL